MAAVPCKARGRSIHACRTPIRYWKPPCTTGDEVGPKVGSVLAEGYLNALGSQNNMRSFFQSFSSRNSNIVSAALLEDCLLYARLVHSRSKVLQACHSSVTCFTEQDTRLGPQLESFYVGHCRATDAPVLTEVVQIGDGRLRNSRAIQYWQIRYTHALRGRSQRTIHSAIAGAAPWREAGLQSVWQNSHTRTASKRPLSGQPCAGSTSPDPKGPKVTMTLRLRPDSKTVSWERNGLLRHSVNADAQYNQFDFP